MTDPELRSALVSDARHRAARKREASSKTVGYRRVFLADEALLLETMADVMEGDAMQHGGAARQDAKWTSALDEIAGMPLCYDPASGHSKPRGPTVREWVEGMRAEIAQLRAQVVQPRPGDERSLAAVIRDEATAAQHGQSHSFLTKSEAMAEECERDGLHGCALYLRVLSSALRSALGSLAKGGVNK